MRTTFDEAIAPGEKDYDFNIQQYGITAERDEIVDFSLPYYNDQKALLVPGDSPAATATSFADIQDLKYGATIGTTDADYITEAIGIPEADVAIYDDQAATFAALDAGQIDATVIGLPTALYITDVEMPQITIAGLLPRVGEGDEGDMGMLFAEGNPARDCVNTALQSLTDDGTLDGARRGVDAGRRRHRRDHRVSARRAASERAQAVRDEPARSGGAPALVRPGGERRVDGRRLRPRRLADQPVGVLAGRAPPVLLVGGHQGVVPRRPARLLAERADLARRPGRSSSSSRSCWP